MGACKSCGQSDNKAGLFFPAVVVGLIQDCHMKGQHDIESFRRKGILTGQHFLFSLHREAKSQLRALSRTSTHRKEVISALELQAQLIVPSPSATPSGKRKVAHRTMLADRPPSPL